MKMLSDFVGREAPSHNAQLEDMRRRDAERWRRNMVEGDFEDAMVRIFLAIGFADQVVRRKGYQTIGRLFAASPRMKDLDREDLQQIVREQSRIVQTDLDQAIATLPQLLPRQKDRRDALAMIAAAGASIGRPLAPQEQAVLDRIKAILEA
jgi:tellurite resistance protein